MFDGRHYIKVFVSAQHSCHALLRYISQHRDRLPTPLEEVTNEGERFASLVTGGYIVREIDTQGEDQVKLFKNGQGRIKPSDGIGMSINPYENKILLDDIQVI